MTIYSSPVINMLARAWHDLIHIELGAEFTLSGETSVAMVQAGNGLFNSLEQEILTLEVVAQVEFNILYGSFPVYQKQFILDCLNHGREIAFNIHRPE